MASTRAPASFCAPALRKAVLLEKGPAGEERGSQGRLSEGGILELDCEGLAGMSTSSLKRQRTLKSCYPREVIPPVLISVFCHTYSI